MSGSQRDTQRRFTPIHTGGEVRAAVRKHEPAATAEIVDELGIERPSADCRRRRLADEDTVESKKIGNSLAWSPTGETER